MSRKTLTLLLVFVVTTAAGASAQSLYWYPTCATYDPVRDCYYVTNQGDGPKGGIVKIDSLLVQSYFNSGQFTRCTGLLIRGDTLYMETLQSVVLFDLNTSAVLTQIPIPGSSRLYAIEGDDSGNLYLSDFEVHKIFKLRIGTWELSTFASGLTKTCGMLFQKSRNRLIVVSGAEQSIISAVSLADSSVTQLVGVGMGDLDRLAADDEGSIYVSDWQYDIVYKFDSDMNVQDIVATAVRDPAGICFDLRRKIMLVPKQTIHSVVFLDMAIGHFNRIWSAAPVGDGTPSDAQGVAWVDYDNDGFDDLFVTNAGTSPGLNNRLFRNNNDGSFTSVASDNIANDGGISLNSTWADYDNDGAIDCFVSNANEQADFLYHNLGDGTFLRVDQDPITVQTAHSTAASWGDYDNDGQVDLFVARRSGSSLFHNNDGSFTEVNSSGLAQEDGLASGASWADYDGDGDLDLFAAFEANGLADANDRLYRNVNGSFSQVAASSIGADGVTTDGGSWGDYDNDGDLDLFVPAAADGSEGADFLYRNDGDGTFTNQSESPVVTSGGNSFGSCWADLNNDGYLDLFVANSYAGTGEPGNFLFWNNGDNSFSRDTVGQIVTDTAFSNSVAASDYDLDGDLDLFVTQTGGRNNMFYRNNLNSGRWIELKCVGRESNTSAIGTRIRVKAEIDGSPVWQMREISSQTGFGGQNSLTVHFGLQSASVIDTIRIEWPSGAVNVMEGVTVNQLLTIYETCCQARVGDANGVGTYPQEVTISDIQLLVTAKFIVGSCAALPCLAEADVNQSGEADPTCNDITISDIQTLVITCSSPARRTHR
ncbi:MAG: FG-GAP-like repeat-containing protein [candidate division Zixibacteria bacterium]|nr:FG-GAP-like repeat-containing protein [candidate division Zixibacteria bacterium]